MSNIVYRELTTKSELLAYFSLRYQEYPRAGIRIDSNADLLDIETFDFFGRFTGAFVVEGNEERLVGGVRMVAREQEGPCAPLIREICGESSDLAKILRNPRPHPFQLMNVLDLRWLLEACDQAGNRLVEFGRTVVDQTDRNVRVGSGLIEAAFELGRSSGADLGVGYCPEGLRGFYERTGCRVLERFFHPLQQWWGLLLMVDLAVVQDPAHGALEVGRG